MVDLIVQSNDVEYKGAFARPAFSLWGEGKQILAGLFDAYDLADLSRISLPSSGEAPDDHAVDIRFGDGGRVRFRFDRIEARLRNFNDADLDLFPELIQRGVGWLYRAIPDHRFSMQLVSYAAHGVLSAGTGEEFLRSTFSNPLAGMGLDQGTGVHCHFELPDRGWTVGLTLDRSVREADGLFLGFDVWWSGDSADYTALLRDARGVLNESLEKLGLRLPPNA